MSMHPEVGTGMTRNPIEDPQDPAYILKRHNARVGIVNICSNDHSTQNSSHQ